MHFLNRLDFLFKGILDFRKSRDDAGAFNATKTIIGSFSLFIRYIGVMSPFLGRGLEGVERGVKLALIGKWITRFFY